MYSSYSYHSLLLQFDTNTTMIGFENQLPTYYYLRAVFKTRLLFPLFCCVFIIVLICTVWLYVILLLSSYNLHYSYRILSNCCLLHRMITHVKTERGWTTENTHMNKERRMKCVPLSTTFIWDITCVISSVYTMLKTPLHSSVVFT
jgi:hypothetical protein